MSAIKFACISPHPPIIVHEVGRGREREVQRTIDALEQVAADIGLHRPGTVLLMATHGPVNPGAVGLLTAPEAQGDFARWGAPEVSLRFQTDRDLIEAVREEAGRSDLPLDAADRRDSGRHGPRTGPPAARAGAGRAAQRRAGAAGASWAAELLVPTAQG